ncbi:hypothetical protein PF003_g13982 [Phytophthora fragariae]|nr:hypothetical protein PF003_g13982 [Phytophthora fragariae]
MRNAESHLHSEPTLQMRFRIPHFRTRSGRSSRARSHRRVSPYPARGNVAHQDPPEDEETPDTVFAAEQAASGGFAQVLRTAAGAESQADCVGQQRVSAGSSQDLRAPVGAEHQVHQVVRERAAAGLTPDLPVAAGAGHEVGQAVLECVAEALSWSYKQPLELDAAKNKSCKSESQPESASQTCPSLVEQATTKDKQCQSDSQPEALLRSCKQLLELH